MKELKRCALTDVGNDTGQDDLLLASSLDGRAEFGIVPSINFAVALNQGSIWIHRKNLLRKLLNLVSRLTFPNIEIIDLTGPFGPV